MPRWDYRFKRSVIDFLVIMACVLVFLMTLAVGVTRSSHKVEAYAQNHRVER